MSYTYDGKKISIRTTLTEPGFKFNVKKSQFKKVAQSQRTHIQSSK